MCHPVNLLQAVIPERGFLSWRDFHATSKPLRRAEWDGTRGVEGGGGANFLTAKLNLLLIIKPEVHHPEGSDRGQRDCVLALHVLNDINVTSVWT